MTNIELRPLQQGDIDILIPLVRRIWLPHYAPIVDTGTIEHILAARLTHENLGRYIGAEDRGLDVLWDGGEAIGYCSYARTGNEVKLEQLYLLPAYKGRGLGRRMMEHILAWAEATGARTIFLQVNKANREAIAVYERSGFRLREAVVIDIGNGHVMDDYIFEKTI